jgi:hypothetical protein
MVSGKQQYRAVPDDKRQANQISMTGKHKTVKNLKL